MKEFMLYGYVGGDEFNPEELGEYLTEAGGQDIRCTVISEGGDVFAEKAMSAMIKGYPGKKTAVVLGIAASAASKFILAFDEIEMDEEAYLMIHNPTGGKYGDASKMRQTAAVLEGIENEYAEAYAARTGMPMDKCKEMMKAETWLTAAQALEMKFVDRVISTAKDSRAAACISALDLSGFGNVPGKFNAKTQTQKGKVMFDKIQAMFPGSEADAVEAKVREALTAAAKVTDLESRLTASLETSRSFEAKAQKIEAELTDAKSKLARFEVAEVRTAILAEAGVSLSDAMQAKLDSRVQAFLKETDANRKSEIREDAVLFAKANGVTAGTVLAGTPDPRTAPVEITGKPEIDEINRFNAEYERVKKANPTLAPLAWADMAKTNLKGAK